ncbi:7708_t:CDS:2, partial [Scutellospora calospora]
MQIPQFLSKCFGFFFQRLKDLSRERDERRLMKLEKNFVIAFHLENALKNAWKFVNVTGFFVAATLENAIVIANFYLQDAVRIFLNCFFAAVIVTFVTLAFRRENAFCVAVFAVESIVVALNCYFPNTKIVFLLNIFFAAVNAIFTNIFTFEVFQDDFKDFLVFTSYALNVLNAVTNFIFFVCIITIKFVDSFAKDQKEIVAILASEFQTLIDLIKTTQNHNTYVQYSVYIESCAKRLVRAGNALIPDDNSLLYRKTQILIDLIKRLWRIPMLQLCSTKVNESSWAHYVLQSIVNFIADFKESDICIRYKASSEKNNKKGPIKKNDIYGVYESEHFDLELMLGEISNGPFNRSSQAQVHIKKDRNKLSKCGKDALDFVINNYTKSHNYDLDKPKSHDKNVLVHDSILKIADFSLSKSLESNSLSVKGKMPAYSVSQYIMDKDNFKRKELSDIYSLVSGRRETQIDRTPVDFINLYFKAWDKNLDLHPTINK